MHEFVRRHEVLVNTEMILKWEKRLDFRYSVRMAQYAAAERVAFNALLRHQDKETVHWMQRHTEWVQAHYKMHHLALFPEERYMTLSLLSQALYYDLVDRAIPATRALASSFIGIHRL